MKKTLIYTFKTFPYKDDLSFIEFSVFGKLNDDIENFCHKILVTKPDRILGLAKSTKKYSTIEKYSINEFHRNKKILNDAPNIYELDVPDDLK